MLRFKAFVILHEDISFHSVGREVALTWSLRICALAQEYDSVG